MPWSASDLRAYLKRYFRRPTIEELEAMLDADQESPIEILPNGTIRATGSRAVPKPLTMRENLGGEYAHA